MQCKSLYLVLEGESIHKACVILNVVSSPSLQIMLALNLLRSARNYFLTLPTNWMHQLGFVWLVIKLTRLSNLAMVLSGCKLDFL